MGAGVVRDGQQTLCKGTSLRIGQRPSEGEQSIKCVAPAGGGISFILSPPQEMLDDLVTHLVEGWLVSLGRLVVVRGECRAQARGAEACAVVVTAVPRSIAGCGRMVWPAWEDSVLFALSAGGGTATSAEV